MSALIIPPFTIIVYVYIFLLLWCTCVQGAKTEMEKFKFDEMTCKEAMKQVCKM